MDGMLQVSAVFPYQSYFDDVLLDAAVLRQGMGLIVDTTATPAQDCDLEGYGVALDPTAETPIAIQFKRQFGQSSVTLLRPGQTLIPFGRDPADAFLGFRWGLPAGWLGGGRATITVMQSPRSEIAWQGIRSDILFHRQTMQIQAKTYDLTANVTSIFPNWPLRFPSVGTRGAAGSQAGMPSFGIDPTYTMIRLKAAAALAAASTVRFLFFATKEFDTSSAGALVQTPIAFQDVKFGLDGVAGVNSPVQMPVQTYASQDLLASVGIDAINAGSTGIGVVAVDLGDGSDLSTSKVQILRYGRL